MKMLRPHAYLTIFTVLFPEACFALPSDSPISKTELQGRFYFIGKDLTAPSNQGVVVTQSLYEMPASGGSPLPRLPDYKHVSNLVWYPSSARIGLNNSDDPHRGPFLSAQPAETIVLNPPCRRSSCQCLRTS